MDNIIHILPVLFTVPKEEFNETLYALSKGGKVRIHNVRVKTYAEKTELITTKKIGFDGKETTDVYTFTKGKNIGKSNETTHYTQALSEAKSIVNSLLDEGFLYDVPNGKFNKDAQGNIKPMKAIPFNKDYIQYPCLVQPKYDGVRCLLLEVGGEVKIVSKKGKDYDIPRLKKWAEDNRKLLPLDGELYNHKELTFQEIISAVKKKSSITDRISFVAYDVPRNGMTFRQRERLLDSIISTDVVHTSESQVCNTFEDILRYHEECVKNGYEGVIIRNYNGMYEFGFRSNDLIKYKRFDTEEFVLIDVVEASGRDAGTALFVLKTKMGGVFRARPKGSRELRTDYLREKDSIIGKFVTVQFQGLTDGGIPRFPSAIAIRDYE